LLLQATVSVTPLSDGFLNFTMPTLSAGQYQVLLRKINNEMSIDPNNVARFILNLNITSVSNNVSCRRRYITSCCYSHVLLPCSPSHTAADTLHDVSLLECLALQVGSLYGGLPLTINADTNSAGFNTTNMAANKVGKASSNMHIGSPWQAY
jgi:hypothetical protein